MEISTPGSEGSRSSNIGAPSEEVLTTDGLDGTSAKTLVASIDSQVMAFDDTSDTSATPIAPMTHMGTKPAIHRSS